MSGAAVVAAAAMLLAGCSLIDKVPHAVGLADRCAGFMRAAMPFADIDITQRTSQGIGLDRIIARVAGTRTGIAKDLPHDLAVECQFDGGVLTAFHWTKGAPPHLP